MLRKEDIPLSQVELSHSGEEKGYLLYVEKKGEKLILSILSWK
jgi:hypothetical protein